MGAAFFTAIFTVGVPVAPTANAAVEPRNVVMIMADDFSWDLVPYMSELQQLMADGVTFDNYYVTNSLCCVSRSSILTGRFPQNTGVLRNSGAMGGISAFLAGLAQDGSTRDNEYFTYAIQQQNRGYYTGLEGKYLNGYGEGFKAGDKVRRPPGWTLWRPYNSVAYGEYNFAIGIPGSKAVDSTQYGTDQIKKRVRSLIPLMAERGSPFNLTLVPFSPHYGNLTDTSVPTFPAAYRDRPKSKANENGDYANGDCGLKSDGTRRDCHTIMIESLPGNETMNCTADTSERPKAKPDSNDGPCELQQYLRDRIRMVQSLDELIRAVREELTEAGLWESTYLIFTSDNGYHLGQGIALGLIEDGSAGFRIGKGSPFETDLRVPLVVAGADAAVGVVRHEPAQGVDFLPTFTDMQPSLNGDTTTFENHDGMSLLPLIRGESVTGWRNWVYSVHTEVPDASSAGPDSEPGTLVQKGFFSLRAGGELYVQHVDGADRGIISRYTIEETPNGRYNNPLDWAALPIGTQDLIRSQFDMFAKCIGGETAGATSCQAAARAAAP